MTQKFFSGVVILLSTCVLIGAASAQTFKGVLTQHNDNSRTGQNLDETILNQSNVWPWEFGKLFSYAVDGQIYAQPLYMPNVTIKGASHNVIFVATEYNSLYAFDADATTNNTSNTLWHRSFNNVAKGVVPVPCGAQTAAGGAGTEISCNVFPFYGITGTPVIDPTNNTMYLIVRTSETTSGVTTYYQRLHAINIETGADKSGSPVVVSASVPGTGAGSIGGTVTFDPLADIQRVGMTLANGILYTGWAGAAHGWIMAYNEKTLEQTAVLNTAPNAVLGGVWQTGNGFVVDHDGNIDVAVGDALFDVNTGGVDYGDAVLKLNPTTLAVEDYFTPMDQSCRQMNDLDVGSAGPIILPTQVGTYPNEVLVIGKSGTGIAGCPDTTDVYLLNQDDLGQYETGQNNSDNVIQELTDPPGSSLAAQGFWSSPAFWQGEMAGTSYVYMAGTSANNNGNGGAPLDQYSLTEVGDVTQLTLMESSSNLFPQGSTPSVSSNGSNSGTGMVWAVERIDSLDQQPGGAAAVLYAYNATNVTNPQYQSNGGSNGKRDQAGCNNKFVTPTIANGKVYVGTMTQLDIYGLLPSNPPASPGVYVSPVCNTYNNVVLGQKSQPFTFTVTNFGNASLSITSVSITGPNAADFNKNITNKCGKTLAAGASCNISVIFAPSTAEGETAFLNITDSAPGSPHNIGLYGQADQPSVNVVPSNLSFGLQDINIASAAQTVTVSNSSNLVVSVSSVTITGTNASLFTQTNNCTSIAVNGNCTINVTFEPTVTGDFSANLNITDNAAGSPQVVSLSGAGVQPNAVITSPNPPQINFGQVKVGSSSTSQPVSLLNNGGGSLIISSITFTGGTNPNEFSQTNNCNGMLASGATCTINVTFKPTVSGLAQAYMNINDNSVPSPQQVSLSGSGD